MMWGLSIWMFDWGRKCTHNRPVNSTFLPSAETKVNGSDWNIALLMYLGYLSYINFRNLVGK